jgi:imidazolonepropionase-like amidohydrolase
MRARSLPFLFTAILAAGAVDAGQEPAYAIVGARVVTVSGVVHDSATVVMRDGVIEAVGPSVAAPPDARVIDGKGLTLTPGLIDGLGGLGLPKAPRKKDAPKDDGPAVETLAPRAFALDKIRARDALKARNAGVTTALVIPGEGVLPGRSVLLNLSGDTPQGMALVQPAALHLDLMPLRDKYPDSLMGVVALARQSLWSAVHYRDEWAAYLRSPRGKKRPRYDADLEAWRDVVSGKLPLFVTAHRENDVRRVLDLADELKIRIVLAGAPQAARLADLIKARKLPLLVGVNFDPPREARFQSLDDDERERQDIDEAERNPAALHRAGLSFGFGSGHADDYLAGIRTAIVRGLPRDAALRAATLGAAEVLGVADRLGSLETGKIANLVAWSGEPLAADAKVKLVFVDGQLYEPEAMTRDEKEKEHAARSEEERARGTSVAPWAPPVAPAPPKGPVAIVGGTLLTVSPQGTIENGTVLIENGRITALGRGLTPPAGALVIDARGRYVMPGIIDAHSHTAIEDNVNECTDSVTAEVRIADVLDHEDPDIYRQLAGGVTTLNVLHGSCNAIGGQNAVIKLRYGKSPRELLFAGAPRGIKFALGENPKRSYRRSDPPRYPGTRMGVEAIIRASFEEARAYERSWEDYARKLAAAGPGAEKPVAPRRDLRLEELKDVLEGKVLVHAHCYRADEILMLMHVADDFGFKIRTFQHVLEGYKVASEIARHGAGASTFIDWWAFKLEAYDGTPYNPAILASHGVRVSLNSDSAELARRLYWDAAKAVKYGGVSETEALKMITLNPAWQLGIDGRVGSLEVGKDADVAIFSAHPFSPDARVEMTLVDGTVYFDRSKAVLAAGGAR